MKSDTIINFSEIKRRRLAMGATFEEAARLAGFPSRVRWYQIESGTRSDPRISTIVAMASALNCSVDDLIHPQKPTKTS